MTNIKKLIQTAGVGAALFAPLAALAQSINQPTVPIGGTAVTLGDITDWVQTIATTLMGVAVFIAIIFIVWGGITYMAAGGDEAKAGEAKKRILNGIIGAAVVLGVGLILQTVAALVQ